MDIFDGRIINTSKMADTCSNDDIEVYCDRL